MNKPVIGISANLHKAVKSTRDSIRLPAAYVLAVQEAGGIPLILPALDPERALRELYERAAGIVLIGGRDISPHFYRQSPHHALHKAPIVEDHAHLQLARWMVEDRKPFLAICRGHQVLNVALGGTLIQDIPSELPHPVQHSPTGESAPEVFHPIRVEPSSRLAAVLGSTALEVNSSHHQAAAVLGTGLVPTAWSPDEVLEAMEIPDHPCGISVQWHPERILEQPGMLALFTHLVSCCCSG